MLKDTGLNHENGLVLEKIPDQPTAKPASWFRVFEVFLGLASILVSIVILANLNYGETELLELLALALIFNAVRMMGTGGVKKRLASLEALGLIGGGFLAAITILVAIFLPGLSFATLVYLFAITLTIQGLGRVFHSIRRGPPGWLRGSALAVGALTVLLAVIAVAIPNIALLTLVPLVAMVVLVSGVEMIVWGLHPTDPRQITLLKLILFSAFYGLVLINWVDLYQNLVPGYHIWLVLTYMAPFGVLIVFQGRKDWQLALSLGLLVSLMNDLGYFFVGDLLFGFHRDLLPWIEGQLGFMGTKVLFYFQGGAFNIPVSSYLMGFTIYARIAVVAVILYHWWRQLSKLPG